MKFKLSDHYDGDTFSNMNGYKPYKSFIDVFKWKWTSTAAKWPNELVCDNLLPDVQSVNSDAEFKITYVNHASLLIQFKGVNIITDPLLFQGIGPFSLETVKRHRPVGVSLEQLPRIDIVLISHNHYDHLDLSSVYEINKKFKPQFFIPLGMSKDMPKIPVNQITEMDWWEVSEIAKHKLKIHFVPAQHWSKRTLIDTNKSLWGGFIVEKNRDSNNSLNQSQQEINSDSKFIFFAGDTGYGIHFQEIHKRFPIIDVALLPIGAYEPRWFMKEAHMNPEDAVKASLDLKARFSIGIHFGTFQLTDEGIEDPVNDLKTELEKQNIPSSRFVAPKNGQTFKF